MLSDKDRATYKALGMLTVLYRWGLVPNALQADARAIIVLADGESAAIAADEIATLYNCDKRADARLIAAAPALYEALRALVDNDDAITLIANARAAIAKAEGK